MKYCPECGTVRTSDKCKCGYAFPADDDNPIVHQRCRMCGNNNADIPVGVKIDKYNSRIDWYCDKHYHSVIAKNQMIEKYGFEFCKKYNVINW
jgi:hypothetical protein